MPTARRWLGLAFALATGIAAAYIDTRPRFDDTGVLVVGLVGGGVVAALVAGRAAIGWAVLLVLATGLPVPAAEMAGGGSPASLLALAFAAAGVLIGTAATRLVQPEPHSIG